MTRLIEIQKLFVGMLILLGIMVYTDRFLNHLAQYIVQDCVTQLYW